MKLSILAATSVLALAISPIALAGKPASETNILKCPECGKPIEVSLHADKKTNTLSIKLNKIGSSANPKN